MRIVGCLVALAAGAYLGLDALRLPSPPSGTSGAIGVAATIKRQRVTGLQERTFIVANGCSNPVHVAVVLAGDTALWKRHPISRVDRLAAKGRAPGESAEVGRVGIAIPSAGVDQPAAYQGSIEELVNTFYTYPTGQHLPYPDFFDAGSFRKSRGWWDDQVRLLDWPATHSAIAIFFSASWIAGRSAGTCYLLLPRLTGIGPHYATIAAEQTIGESTPHNALAEGVSATLSTNAVLAARDVVTDTSGAIDAASSTPSPDILDSENHVGWDCTRSPATRGAYSFNEGTFETYQNGSVIPGPAPVAGQPIGRPADCSAIAVIDAGSDLRDGQLFLAGVLLPLGLGLILVDGMISSSRGAILHVFTPGRFRNIDGQTTPPAVPQTPETTEQPSASDSLERCEREDSG